MSGNVSQICGSSDSHGIRAIQWKRGYAKERNRSRGDSVMEVVMSGSGSTCLLVGIDSCPKLSPEPADGCARHDQSVTISVFTERPV